MIDNPETIATAIRIGHPQSWDLAWNVQKEWRMINNLFNQAHAFVKVTSDLDDFCTIH
jgi:threonine synthase